MQQEVFHQFARVQAMTQWWHWLLLAVVCLLIVVYVVATYFRDSVELGRARRMALLLLRLLAFAGILFFFLDLEKRSQREVVKNSRALVLVDTSLSMGIQDASTASGQRRIDQAIEELQRGELLDRLRQEHDVVVFQFDQDATPTEVASFPKWMISSEDGDAVEQSRTLTDALKEGRLLAAISGGVLLVSLFCLFVYFLRAKQATEERTDWSFVIGIVGLLSGIVLLSVANLRHPEIDLLTTVGLKTTLPTTGIGDTEREDSQAMQPVPVDWETALAPQGVESRLGDAIRALVRRERDGATAGIIVLTDGGSNAGVDIDQAVATAKAAGIALFPIGLGDAERPANVKVIDIEAPARVYPGDSFTLNGFVQSFGFAGRTVKVEILSKPADTGDDVASQVQDEQSVRLGSDGEVVPIHFEIIPEEQGERLYELRVAAPNNDHEVRDNQRSAKVQVVERKNRVLLFAGGPSREFRFLRDLLFRDPNVNLHVLLQSGRPGMSQEANRLLFEFPSTAEELFEYDCVVGFDPNWLALDDLQIQLLERWVSEEAGGLTVIAGPVHTPRWASRLRSDPRIDTIKSLYPIVFYSRGSATLSLGRFASETPWPLEFTRNGEDAEFLWLEDDPLLSRAAWDSFAGVYGYYAVKDPKPGARVYAHFSDPSTSIDGELPIYMAGHFYGAGRVFFQASGEMWRVRALNDSFFERYYTKLIRWVSQGRLLRDSSRGILLTDTNRCQLGDHVSVRAILSDAQFQPLLADQVTATLVDPNGNRQSFVLRNVQEAARAGMFSAQFTATLDGDYRIELQPPHGDDDELLVSEVRSRIPALETEQPERHDPLLKNLAEQTGGAYYVGLDSAMNRDGAGLAPIANLLEPLDQVSYVAGTPDRTFERILMIWLMGFICGALFLEWLIRRLSRLA
jgi:hypothetical protein